MTSLLQKIIQIGLGIVSQFIRRTTQLLKWPSSASTPVCGSNGGLGIHHIALWGKFVQCPLDLANNDREDENHVAFDTYLFPLHAAAVLATGKYPLLRRKRITLCLNDNQFRGMRMFLETGLVLFAQQAKFASRRTSCIADDALLSV
ncbi:uncharacterized protein IL334_001998 [Kwoniella shivajii]|uniref:Uncharacterized protein n=1 Tax=Kwoniella shivajii TaxID=564305 RepID=A0ABZ1CTQ6_9TREE|nr:hypothetical protein IL334_001998 [Kwoniella shivajii]